jgi:lysophospholipase L1-like esterase
MPVSGVSTAAVDPVASLVAALNAATAALTASTATSLQKSSNLSDVTSAGTSRTNLGLGAAALLSTTQIAADSALTNTYGNVKSGGNAIVYLGDSITLGATDYSANSLGASFPLYAQLFSKGRCLMVRNAGIAGNTTTQMLARFDTDVTPYAPATVFILGGTNDSGALVATATYQANIAAIVAKVRAIGARPVLGTIAPNNAGGTRMTLVRQWNNWLKRYGAANGITVVDFYATLADPTNGQYLSAYSSGDGTHPNEAGYRC